jgi:hypothetical protein
MSDERIRPSYYSNYDRMMNGLDPARTDETGLLDLINGEYLKYGMIAVTFGQFGVESNLAVRESYC